MGGAVRQQDIMQYVLRIKGKKTRNFQVSLSMHVLSNLEENVFTRWWKDWLKFSLLDVSVACDGFQLIFHYLAKSLLRHQCSQGAVWLPHLLRFRSVTFVFPLAALCRIGSWSTLPAWSRLSLPRHAGSQVSTCLSRGMASWISSRLTRYLTATGPRPGQSYCSATCGSPAVFL